MFSYYLVGVPSVLSPQIIPTNQLYYPELSYLCHQFLPLGQPTQQACFH